MFLSVFILPFSILGCQTVEVLAYSHQEKMVSSKTIGSDMFKVDPVMILLGKLFREVVLFINIIVPDKTLVKLAGHSCIDVHCLALPFG